MMPRFHRFRTPIAVVLAVFGAGCVSLEDRLCKEREIPELADLGQRLDRAGLQTVLIPADEPVHGPIRLAFHESGQSTAPRVIVLVHGVLADARAWRYMQGALVSGFRTWAVDLPGCGESDKPRIGQLAADAWSPDWLAGLLLDALRRRLVSEPRPLRLTLVGHSLGGSILLRMFGASRLRQSHGDVLARIDSLCLMAPLDFGYAKADPLFVEIANASSSKVMLGAATGLLRAATAEAIYHGGVYKHRLPGEGVEQLYAVLRDDARREASQWMIRRALPLDPELRPCWSQVEELTAAYADVDVPCLVLWGARDETLPAQSGDRLVHALPQAWLRIVTECKHALPTEEPRLCADLLRRFLSEPLSTWPEVLRLPRPPAP
jgi:pimeloyl-ACP methyl ester carboxylesterase